MRSKTSRGEGLVPRWGGGGAWQNPRCQFAVPSHNSSPSYLGAPAPAGMSDCYESMSPAKHSSARRPGPRSWIDRCGNLASAIRGIPSSLRPPIGHSGEGRNPEGRGEDCGALTCSQLGHRPIRALCSPETTRFSFSYAVFTSPWLFRRRAGPVPRSRYGAGVQVGRDL